MVEVENLVKFKRLHEDCAALQLYLSANRPLDPNVSVMLTALLAAVSKFTHLAEIEKH